ncbi:MAG: hypothetical protein VXY77_03685 [Pseudomonadota bacterium]|nr:hypothetical protein [Pseudomonadota bacterium]
MYQTQELNIHQRLMYAVDRYERKKSEGLGLHPQRKQDIDNLRNLIDEIVDEALLKREVAHYVSNIKSKKHYFFITNQHSELREIISYILRDEQRKQLALIHSRVPDSVQCLLNRIDSNLSRVQTLTCLEHPPQIEDISTQRCQR